MLTLQITIDEIDYQALANLLTSKVNNPVINAFLKPIISAIKLVPQDKKNQLVSRAINKEKDRIISYAEHESEKNGIKVKIKDISAST